MLLALLIFLVILLCFQALILILIKNLSLDVITLQSDMSLIRRTFITPHVGGRAVPTPAEIAAARARAPTLADVQMGRNQVDASGVAHIGGPQP